MSMLRFVGRRILGTEFTIERHSNSDVLLIHHGEMLSSKQTKEVYEALKLAYGELQGETNA